MLQGGDLDPYDMADLANVRAGVAQLVDDRLDSWQRSHPTEPVDKVRLLICMSGCLQVLGDSRVGCLILLSELVCVCNQMPPILLPTCAPLEYRVRLHCRVVAEAAISTLGQHA